MSMYCYQCEDASNGQACTVDGVCGKTERTAKIQDVMVYAVKSVARYAWTALQGGSKFDEEVMNYIYAGMVLTASNVNFDEKRIFDWLYRAGEMRNKAKALFTAGVLHGVDMTPPLPETGNLADYLAFAPQVGVMKPDTMNPDVRSWREMLTYGIKGIAANAYLAREYGNSDSEIDRLVLECIAATADERTISERYISLNVKLGGANMRVMELIDEGMRERFGEAGPTPVTIGSRKGHAILVSGNNFLDLEAVLEQTRDLNINVYTHGEMLPAHAYPRLQKYPHLVGNYGGAWQNQQRDFEDFPGSILMAGENIQRPTASCKNRIFTTGLVGWPGVLHLEKHRFDSLIDAARTCPGFKEDRKVKELMVGYGHRYLMTQVDRMVRAMKDKSIRHFFLIGGCDGASEFRDYFTDFAQMAAKDSLIFTMGSGKYRLINNHFGKIGEFPRIMDLGQSSDIFSAVKFFQALSESLRCQVNNLPLSIIYSWQDQKSISSLLSLLNMGIKDKIKIGPSRPAWVTQNVWKVLEDKYNLRITTTAEMDLKAIFGEKARTAAS